MGWNLDLGAFARDGTTYHLLFPTGRPPSARWWWVAGLAVAANVLIMISLAVAAWPLRGPGLLEGPFVGPEVQPPPRPTAVGFTLLAVSLVASLLAMVSGFAELGARYANRSSGSCMPA